MCNKCVAFKDRVNCSFEHQSWKRWHEGGNCSERNWDCDCAVGKAPAVQFQLHAITPELRHDISLDGSWNIWGSWWDFTSSSPLSFQLKSPLLFFCTWRLNRTPNTRCRWGKQQQQWSKQKLQNGLKSELMSSVSESDWSQGRQGTNPLWKTKKTRCHF